MKLTRAQREAKLRKAADEMIEGLLAWEDQNSAPNLTQIEDEILTLRRQMGEAILAVTLAGQEASQPAENPTCAHCGGEMRNKGAKSKAVESRVGGVEIERSYYYCTRCQSGIFPPGPATCVGKRTLE